LLKQSLPLPSFEAPQNRLDDVKHSGVCRGYEAAIPLREIFLCAVHPLTEFPFLSLPHFCVQSPG
ncbi:unnamed protein product, partial [Closterium sp. Naga37s-1]